MNFVIFRLENYIFGDDVWFPKFIDNPKLVTDKLINQYLKNEKDIFETALKIQKCTPNEVRTLITESKFSYSNPNKWSNPTLCLFYTENIPYIHLFEEKFNKINDKESKFPIINCYLNNEISLNSKIENCSKLIEEYIKNSDSDFFVDSAQILKEIESGICENDSYGYLDNDDDYFYLKFPELIAKYSKRAIMFEERAFRCNADLIDYDFIEIERELSYILLERKYNYKK